MTYHIKITRQAQEQMREIVRYIAYELKAPETAMRFLELLEENIASLSELPQRIPLTKEEPWRSLGIHNMTVKNYLVYFWINEENCTVQVTAVIYEKRNQRDLLSDMNLE